MATIHKKIRGDLVRQRLFEIRMLPSGVVSWLKLANKLEAKPVLSDRLILCLQHILDAKLAPMGLQTRPTRSVLLDRSLRPFTRIAKSVVAWNGLNGK